MAEYAYKVRNQSGQDMAGSIVAGGIDEARTELRRQGYQVVTIEAKAAGGLKGFIEKAQNMQIGGPPKVKQQDLIVFTRQMATMLSAGIPLLECLEIMAEQTDNLGFRKSIEQIVDDVRAGADFSESLRKHPKTFSNIYVNMIRAGEASGQLDDILGRLAEYQEAAAKLKAKIQSAMMYPIISLSMILLIVLGLLLFIVPKFQEIFISLEIELPLPTRILLGTSEWLQNNAFTWVGGSIAIYFGLKYYAKTKAGGYQVDWLLLRVPVFGPLFRKVALSRFARTFSTLIQSGVPILGALEIVAATAGNRVIEGVVNEASASVRQGDTLASPLSQSSVFPPMVTRMIAIGEKSGALEGLLEKIAEFYDQQVETTVESLTSLIEPIMIAVMGVLVGGMVLAIFLPIMELVKNLG